MQRIIPVHLLPAHTRTLKDPRAQVLDLQNSIFGSRAVERKRERWSASPVRATQVTKFKNVQVQVREERAEAAGQIALR